MTIQQLIYVIEIEKQGSINAAANSLYTSQPTISIAIKEIEEEIGYRIFSRTNKGIILTSQGAEFIHHAKKVLYEYDTLNEICLQKTRQCEIKFRVSSQHYAFLNEAFIRFLNMHKHNSYNFVIKETKSLEAINDVYQKKSDLAFIMIGESNRTILNEIFEKKNIVFHNLFNPKPHVFLNKNHPLALNKTIALEQLVEYPVIIFEQDGSDLLAEELIVQKKLSKVIYVNDRATLIGIVSNSDAYNIGTGYLSKEMTDSGMKSIPMEVKQTHQEIGWIHLEKYEPSLLVYQFIDIAKDLLKTK